MKKNIFFISILLIIIFLFFNNYFNSDTMKPEDFKGTEPTINIEKYFEGPVKAWGLLQDRKGKVTRQFKADMFGHCCCCPVQSAAQPTRQLYRT